MFQTCLATCCRLRKIAALCHERGVPLVVDCSQSAGILPVSLGKLHAAFLCMPGTSRSMGRRGRCSRMRACAPAAARRRDGSLSKARPCRNYARCGRSRDTQCAGICALCEGVRFVKNVGLDAICAHGKMLGQLLTAELGAFRACACTMEEIRRAWCRFIGNRGRGANCGKAFIAGLSLGRGSTARLWRTSLPDAFFRHGSCKLLCFQHAREVRALAQSLIS